ncbi:hypothetical protein UPYG_G00112130 [Umbra pygmaea]|uniref:Macro domain-containing protein n=1 Tax=Umbra pygmaea TaxID=75934 RepID=A0ABD0X369_UMBPY
MDKIDNILLDQEMVSILGQCGPALIDALQGKFGCTAVLHGVEASSAGNSKKPAPEIRYTTQLSKGLCVSVWKDDLTTHKAEVVVNAANCDLQHCGGLAKALSDAGGPEIQQESNKFLKNNRPLLTGEAIIANAGRLPCSKIIHAVGPNLPTNPNKYMVKQAIPLLQKTIGSILSIVSGENLKSVAIPAISSGLFNFPLPLCAEIIVKTLKEYNDIYYSGAPLEVRLVNHDDPSVMAMERACKDILGQSNMAHRQLPSYSRTKMTPLSTASFSNAVIHGTGSTPTSLKINNFSLCVKKGNIEEEQTSIIVNTISQDLELSKGAISKAICEKAGRGIQDELKNNRLAKYGDVIKTKGYRLACSAVYHTICSYKNEYQSNEVLAEIVYKCLSLAKESQMLSISFPAIGTGALGFNKHDVAQIMMDTAVEFEKNNSGTYMNICYVIFPSDNDTYMAFTNKFKSLMGAKPNPFKSVGQGEDGGIGQVVKSWVQQLQRPFSPNFAVMHQVWNIWREFLVQQI